MTAQLITGEYVRNALGERRRGSHKGENGRGLIIAGSEHLAGAAVMCAAAAERAGIGTLKALTVASARPGFFRLPEVMVYTVADWETPDMALVSELIDGADCIAVGPGLGGGAGALDAVEAVIASGKPAVIDADGLNALARSTAGRLHGKLVLTPHIGEMARLTGCTTAEITADMENVAREYAARWGCTVLLKSSKSVVAGADGRLMRNVTGNPGLAKGGSGDVLTGITLAMLGQKLSPFDAACAGAYLLGASADEAVSVLNERMLMARDVIDMIDKTLNLSVFSEEKP